MSSLSVLKDAKKSTKLAYNDDYHEEDEHDHDAANDDDLSIFYSDNSMIMAELSILVFLAHIKYSLEKF